MQETHKARVLRRARGRRTVGCALAWRGGNGQVQERGWEYRRRQPQGTVLYEAVRDHLATLLAEASEMGRGLPRYVERDFAKYLECGVLAHDFARVQCENCKDELLVAFSCKGRGVCPSCNCYRARRMRGKWAELSALVDGKALVSRSSCCTSSTLACA